MIAIEITCVTMSGPGPAHEHITHVGGPAGYWSVPVVVEAIEQGKYSFFVRDRYTGMQVAVGVVRAHGKRPHLRTHANGKWTDNLLSLGACPYPRAA